MRNAPSGAAGEALPAWNRTTIMRSAWAKYRRAGLIQFCRATFARILRQRWASARLVAGRGALMRCAWAAYRKAFGMFPRFKRDAFREALRLEWVAVRSDAAARTERARVVAANALPKAPILVTPRQLSPMEIAIDALKYLPSHMSAARAEREIRAAYAR